MLDSIGFIVHPEKSVFDPTKCMERYPCIKNYENMTKSMSDVKKKNIRSSCTEILNEDFPETWKVASILGTISSFSAVQFERLHYRALEVDKIQALKFKKGNFDKKMIIYSAVKDDIG